jgi:hypothetical protein
VFRGLLLLVLARVVHEVDIAITVRVGQVRQRHAR